MRLRVRAKTVLRFAAVLLSGGLSAAPLAAQTLRYDTHREVAIPEYALLRIGPFYSDLTFHQSAGYRYTRSRGAGTDFLYANRRGRIREDGSDFPLISTLDMRNTLLISRRADMDLSLRLQYEHYPRGTQEDDFFLTLPEEGIVGNFSSAFWLTPFIRGTLYDRVTYRTDWIDTRGIVDEYGGTRYRFLDNIVGADLDWRMAEDKNLSLSVSRYDHWPHTRAFRERRHTRYDEMLAYAQRFQPWLSGGLRAQFSQTDYPDARRTGYHRQLYSAFADLHLTRRITASAWGGYSILRIASPGRDARPGERDREGIVWGGTLKGTEGFWIGRPELTHEIGAERRIDEGFDSAYQIVDRYHYRIAWEGTAFQSDGGIVWTEVEPSAAWINPFRDLYYFFNASYPLTSFARLYGHTGYRLRSNDAAAPGTTDEPERLSDYELWIWRVGTGFQITRKINFDTYYQHVQRFSDNDLLQFERDVFQAMFTFTHRF